MKFGFKFRKNSLRLSNESTFLYENYEKITWKN